MKLILDHQSYDILMKKYYRMVFDFPDSFWPNWNPISTEISIVKSGTVVDGGMVVDETGLLIPIGI